MRPVRGSCGSREPEILWGSVGGFLLVAGLAAARTRAWMALAPGCVLKAVTGVPCPTCGGTRAALALAGGHPLAALGWNPLVGAGLMALALYVPYAWLVTAGRLPPLRTGWLRPPMPVWLRGTMAGIVLADWVYLLAVGR
ncbi:MAG: DUF2752 domain-containing protein [Acidobacteriota bacterium]